jgi:hypothetical protein
MIVKACESVSGRMLDSDGLSFSIVRVGNLVLVPAWGWCYEAYRGVSSEFLVTYAKIPGVKKQRIARAIAIANWLAESYRVAP